MERGVGEERRSRPSRVALNHATKDLNYVRAIWICAGAYAAAATHPYPTGASASQLSSLLSPNQARVAWERQAPGRAANASEGCSRLQGGRLQLIGERDLVTTTNINQTTNRKWIGEVRFHG